VHARPPHALRRTIPLRTTSDPCAATARSHPFNTLSHFSIFQSINQKMQVELILCFANTIRINREKLHFNQAIRCME